jgi:hypothetical protein
VTHRLSRPLTGGASLDDLFDSAAKADSLDRMDFRDSIAGFGTQALP